MPASGKYSAVGSQHLETNLVRAFEGLVTNFRYHRSCEYLDGEPGFTFQVSPFLSRQYFADFLGIEKGSMELRRNDQSYSIIALPFSVVPERWLQSVQKQEIQGWRIAYGEDLNKFRPQESKGVTTQPKRFHYSEQACQDGLALSMCALQGTRYRKGIEDVLVAGPLCHPVFTGETEAIQERLIEIMEVLDQATNHSIGQGATASLGVLTPDNTLVTANIGDALALVVDVPDVGDDPVTVEQLTTDHNSENKAEEQRLKKIHKPQFPAFFNQQGRVNGVLAVSKAFGDVGVGVYQDDDSRVYPVISKSPDVNFCNVTPGDGERKFVIVGTDGIVENWNEDLGATGTPQQLLANELGRLVRLGFEGNLADELMKFVRDQFQSTDDISLSVVEVPRASLEQDRVPYFFGAIDGHGGSDVSRQVGKLIPMLLSTTPQDDSDDRQKHLQNVGAFLSSIDIAVDSHALEQAEMTVARRTMVENFINDILHSKFQLINQSLADECSQALTKILLSESTRQRIPTTALSLELVQNCLLKAIETGLKQYNSGVMSARTIALQDLARQFYGKALFLYENMCGRYDAGERISASERFELELLLLISDKYEQQDKGGGQTLASPLLEEVSGEAVFQGAFASAAIQKTTEKKQENVPDVSQKLQSHLILGFKGNPHADKIKVSSIPIIPEDLGRYTTPKIPGWESCYEDQNVYCFTIPKGMQLGYTFEGTEDCVKHLAAGHLSAEFFNVTGCNPLKIPHAQNLKDPDMLDILIPEYWIPSSWKRGKAVETGFVHSGDQEAKYDSLRQTELDTTASAAIQKTTEKKQENEPDISQKLQSHLIFGFEDNPHVDKIKVSSVPIILEDLGRYTVPAIPGWKSYYEDQEVYCFTIPKGMQLGYTFEGTEDCVKHLAAGHLSPEFFNVTGCEPLKIPHAQNLKDPDMLDILIPEYWIPSSWKRGKAVETGFVHSFDQEAKYDPWRQTELDATSLKLAEDRWRILTTGHIPQMLMETFLSNVAYFVNSLSPQGKIISPTKTVFQHPAPDGQDGYTLATIRDETQSANGLVDALLLRLIFADRGATLDNIGCYSSGDDAVDVGAFDFRYSSTQSQQRDLHNHIVSGKSQEVHEKVSSVIRGGIEGLLKTIKEFESEDADRDPRYATIYRLLETELEGMSGGKRNMPQVILKRLQFLLKSVEKHAKEAFDGVYGCIDSKMSLAKLSPFHPGCILNPVPSRHVVNEIFRLQSNFKGYLQGCFEHLMGSVSRLKQNVNRQFIEQGAVVDGQYQATPRLLRIADKYNLSDENIRELLHFFRHSKTHRCDIGYSNGQLNIVVPKKLEGCFSKHTAMELLGDFYDICQHAVPQIDYLDNLEVSALAFKNKVNFHYGLVRVGLLLCQGGHHYHIADKLLDFASQAPDRVKREVPEFSSRATISALALTMQDVKGNIRHFAQSIATQVMESQQGMGSRCFPIFSFGGKAQRKKLELLTQTIVDSVIEAGFHDLAVLCSRDGSLGGIVDMIASGISSHKALVENPASSKTNKNVIADLCKTKFDELPPLGELSDVVAKSGQQVDGMAQRY